MNVMSDTWRLIIQQISTTKRHNLDSWTFRCCLIFQKEQLKFENIKTWTAEKEKNKIKQREIGKG